MKSCYFCLSATFYDAAFHGRSDDGEPEWPPSPLRVFQALVAAAASCGRETSFETQAIPALEWLESLDPPEIVAPIGRTVQLPYRLYVPNNAGDLVAKSWAAGNNYASIASHRTGKDVRPTRLMGGDAFAGGNTVRYLWRMPSVHAAAVHEFIAILSTAARSLTHVGWGIDMAAGHAGLADEQDLSQYRSDQRLEWWKPDVVGTSLRSPQPKTAEQPSTIRSLVIRHESFIRRMTGGKPQDVPPLTAFRVSHYRKAADPSPHDYAAFSLLETDATRSRSFNPTTWGVKVAGMLRHAVAAESISRALDWSEAKVARFVLGHGEPRGETPAPVLGPRLAFLPLPTIAFHGRGLVVESIRRVLVTVLNGEGADEIRDLERLLPGVDLISEQQNKPIARLATLAQSDNMLKYYCQPSATWATVTPVILPGFDDPRKLRKRLVSQADETTERSAREDTSKVLDKLDRRIEELLRKAIRQAGFSEDLARFADIEWRSVGYWPGTEHAFRYKPPEHLNRFRRLHVRITWRDQHGNPVKIPGPISLGGGRFCGLGLFAAGPGNLAGVDRKPVSR